MSDRYPRLWEFIMGYFHEDYDLFGNSAHELMLHYKRNSSQETIDNVLLEIERFKSDNCDNFDYVFANEFRGQFVPESWGYTPGSFLDELKKLLQE